VRRLSYVFYFTYAGLLAVAGAWGAILAGPDVSWFLDVDLDRLDPTVSATLLSQDRFLRAIELGFGLFALRYWREVYRNIVVNRVFLTMMALGVAGRVLGFVVDGRSRAVMYFFAGYELVGLAVILVVTRRTLGRAVGA
jgi:hypothetical protein